MADTRQMVSSGTEVFLRTADGAQDDRLTRGRVGDSRRDTCHITLSGPLAGGETGRPVLVHYDDRGAFVCRMAVVESTTDGAVDVRLTGEAVPAERRRQPRVSYLQILQQVVREPLLAQ